MSTQPNFSSIYERNLPLVLGCAQRILGDAAWAQDVAQDVFMKYMKRWDSDDPTGDAAAFLYRMATHAAINALRDSRRRRNLLQQYDGGTTPGVVCEDRATLRQIMSSMPFDLAQVAAYFFVEGLEQQEIATLLSIDTRTVRRRLEAFRDKAQRLLARRRREGIYAA